MGFRTIAGLTTALVIITSIATIYYNMKTEIDNLTNENLSLKLEVLQSEQNVNTLKDAIELSNKTIESLKIDNEILTEEFNTWKSKPVEVKYRDRVVKEVVTKYRDSNISNNCEAALELLNKISKIKYNDL